jgi:hypothetical protein
VLEVTDELSDLGLATVNHPKTAVNFVGDADPLDYYHFNITTPSNLELKLSGLTENADVQLIDALGRTIAQANNTDAADEFIVRSLDPGSYFVRVNQAAANEDTHYELSLLALEDGGNTLETAQDLGILSGTRRITDAVDSQDTNDYFRFQVNTDGNFNLILNGSDAGIELLDSRGTRIHPGSSPINATLAAGTYYIRVYHTQGNSQYEIEASFNAIPDLAGDSFSTSRDIGPLIFPQTFSDFVGNVDPKDYYRFELQQDSSINFVLEQMTANADLVLFNRQGQEIASSRTNGTVNESLQMQLEAGVYYLAVAQAGQGNNTTYSLALQATPTIAVTPFQIRRVTPDSGSNVGVVTVTIEGAQLRKLVGKMTVPWWQRLT